MQRILEPELMEDMEQAIAYDEADFSESHGRRVELFRERHPEEVVGTVLDLGCGTGDMLERFAKHSSRATFVAVDGSAAMLSLARKRIARTPSVSSRVRFVEAFIPSAEIPRDDYAVIMSHSMLHHLHRPEVLWNAIKELATKRTHVFVSDLRRPDSERAAVELIDRLASGEPEILRRDFYNSLCAAFTTGEVREQLSATDLSALKVEECGETHLLIHGRLTP